MNLLRVLQGEEVEPLRAVAKRDEGDSYALRTERWKYYDGRLFDLRSDPTERHNVAPDDWGLVEQLRTELERILRDGPRHAAEPVELDGEARKRLEALGYL